jgi:hypothetical protein
LDWTSSPQLEELWAERLRDRYPGPWRFCAIRDSFAEDYFALVHFDALRVAVGLSRFEAAHGRKPASLREAGVGELLSRPTTFEGDKFSVQISPANPPRDSEHRLTVTLRRR